MLRTFLHCSNRARRPSKPPRSPTEQPHGPGRGGRRAGLSLQAPGGAGAILLCCAGCRVAARAGVVRGWPGLGAEVASSGPQEPEAGDEGVRCAWGCGARGCEEKEAGKGEWVWGARGGAATAQAQQRAGPSCPCCRGTAWPRPGPCC